MERAAAKRSEAQLQTCFYTASRQRQGILDEGGSVAGLDVEEVREAEREAGGGAGDLEVATETGADHRVTRGRGLVRREVVLRQVMRGVEASGPARLLAVQGENHPIEKTGQRLRALMPWVQKRNIKGAQADYTTK